MGIPTLAGFMTGGNKDRAHTGTSKGLSKAINRGPIRKFQPKYANVYVTIQSHALSEGVQPHYVTADGIRDGLVPEVSGTYVSGHSGVTPVIPANSTPE